MNASATLAAPEVAAASLAARFWPKVDKRGPDECWPWRACRHPRGYGKIGADAKTLVASRVAWEIAHQTQIPPGLFVLHSCDNPPCVNPAHLSLGTARDNLIDAISKGRADPPPSRPLKTHCHRGHPLAEPNLVPNGRTPKGLPAFKCRTCNALKARRHRAKKNGAMPASIRAREMLLDQYKALTTVIKTAELPTLIVAARRYRRKVIWWLRQPEAAIDLALGEMGANGYGPAIADVCKDAASETEAHEYGRGWVATGVPACEQNLENRSAAA